MITKFKTTSTAVILLAISSLAGAEGNAEDGATIGYSCLGCHGIEGYRNAYPSYRVPKLGGQKESYLVIALQGYRDGTREHPTMNAQAESLSDEEIQITAAFLATLGTETVAAGGSSGTSFSPAQTCVACHGQNGISVSPGWPTLAGQHEEYLEHSLNQYRNGERKQTVMAQMAVGLSDADVKLLARYYARLEGLETTQPE